MERSTLINLTHLKANNGKAGLDSPEVKLNELEFSLRERLFKNASLENKYCHIEYCFIKNTPFVIIHFDKSEDRMSFKVDLIKSKEIRNLISSILQDFDYLIFKNKYDWSIFTNARNKFLVRELLTQTSIGDLDSAIKIHAKNNLSGPYKTKTEFLNGGEFKESNHLKSDFWEIEYAGNLYFQQKSK